ncbi:MAG: molecular chaperone TorD [Snowella sp.]|nr:MAG: molecular chaperone TorD [Snowella sp.]
MIPPHQQFEYQVGGSLHSDAPSYVTRKADSIFYQALKAGEFCYVLNSRQMGKSSLRVRASQRLTAEGTVCIFIDLTGMGTQEVNPEKWYAGIVQSIVSGGQLQSKIQWRPWWKDRWDLFSPVQRLGLFIQEVLLVEVPDNIVIFVDEIDRVLSQKFSLDDFFGLIRFIYEQRENSPEYQRLTFALLGVATPNALIQDKKNTPFNIGRAIALKGFQSHEVEPLTEGLKGIIKLPELMMEEILDWSGGQPFLTQKLCKLVLAHPESFSGNDDLKALENLIRSRIIENWEARDEPEHLRTIRDRIFRDESKIGRLLGFYQNILKQGSIPSDGSAEQRSLQLSGLVVENEGKLQVYNRLYAQIFDQAWVERKLAALRPYADTINAWSESGDLSYLLSGQTLQEALGWALGKQLSDLDYQYLVASQELAKQQVQEELTATEQASQLLASARQKATQKVNQQRIPRSWIPKIAVMLAIPIFLSRWGGLWQRAEWTMLDQFFQWRPATAEDQRIAIVTITESDISERGWPLNDRLLAQTIKQIKTQNPKVIGLDLVRNLPLEPGNRELAKLFQTTSNLFGIEKVIEPQIDPPPILKNQKQVGFADLSQDLDGAVRRALLTVELSSDDIRESLAIKLALSYLRSQGIVLESLPDHKVRLGKAIFNRFTANDGGYIRADSGGYQILLNFRGTEKNFRTIELKKVLNKQIPPDFFRDRVVLIGVTAESLKDLFDTPYSGGLFPTPEQMPGVIIHANIASQLISSAMDGRTLIHTWPDPVEYAWILGCILFTTILSWWIQSPKLILLGLILSSSVSIAGFYLAFIFGWWLPIVPSLLAAGGSAIAVMIITNQERDRLLCQYTLTELLNAQVKSILMRKIALEYLKQSESVKNQTLINNQLRNRKKLSLWEDGSLNDSDQREA